MRVLTPGQRGAYPSPLNYCGFPKSCCTSRNEVICHGIPDDVPLQEGDIVNVDVTVFHNGYHGDCSETFAVGTIDQASLDLIQVTHDCWTEAMGICEPGRPYKDVGGVIEDFLSERGYSTVPKFCSHGIGKAFHATPSILHFRNDEPNGVMAVGHTFTIEPVAVEGTSEASRTAVFWPDGWTAATANGARAAQFEHTLVLRQDGVEPLTGKTEDSPRYAWELGRAR